MISIGQSTLNIAGLAILAMILALLPGCSLQAPLPQLTEYSDKGINDWSMKIEDYWGVGSLRGDRVGTVGAIAASTFSMAGFGTSAFGAPVAAPILTGMTAWILQMLGMVQPTTHANAFDDGYNDIQSAKAIYFKNMAGTPIPTQCITGYGAQLYAGIIEAIKAVSQQIKQARVKDPPPPQQGLAREQAMNRCN